MPSLVAFSKDRPPQLELLLRSVARFAPDCPLTVIYTASDELYERGYELVRGRHPGVRWLDERAEGGFKAATLTAVRAAGERLAFLVDDIVLTHPVDPDAPGLRALDEDPELLCCSLRLDPAKDYCYALDSAMRVPAFEDGLKWTWAAEEGDWCYPMSTDGHVFRTHQIVPLLETLDYFNPNSLEAALSEAPLPLPKMTCLDQARLVNVPDNRVQDTALNRHEGGSPRRLTQALLAGRRLDLAPFDGLRTRQVHQEMPLAFEPVEPKPAVSVVIPCHNMAATLAEAVESVRASNFDRPVEIIVVDDGSTDESAAIARGLGVTLLSQPASGHPADARNGGFTAASGDYVLPLDADDRIAPDFLAFTVAALEADPHAGFAYGDELDFGGAQDVFHKTPAYDFSVLARQNFLGSATLVRRSAWEAVGGYDAELGYEDWDLWIALGHAGFHGVKADGAVFEHRVSDGRWAMDIARDREVKARFVLKRPELYDVAQRQWAAGVLEGDAVALAQPDRVGQIPAIVPAVAPAPPARIEIDARTHAVAATADEVAADPGLLRAYAAAFGPDDDVTLVIYADAPADQIAARLEPALAAAGLDRPDAPDLLAVPGGSDAQAAIEARAAAALTRRVGAFGGLPRFDDGSVGELRRALVGETSFEVPDDMAWAFGPDGFYEQDVTEWFDRLVQMLEPRVVYDVGANCGWFAVRAARAGAAVRAFEPVPTTADVLERNLRGTTDTRVIRAAVGEAPGTALMHLYSSCGNNSLVERQLPPGHALRHTGRHEVEILRLDDLVGGDGFPAPELVKIDIEGYELHALRGARETLRRHRPALLLEWSVTTCRDAGYDRAELVTELRSLGYDVSALGVGGGLVDPETAGEECETLIALPSGVELTPPAPSEQDFGPEPRDPNERFRWELARYRAMPGGDVVRDEDLNPQLGDRTPTTPYDQHYFFQDVWAARRVAEIRPERHVDVGSRIDYVGFLTAICPVAFVDIRPLPVDIEDFESITGSILEMPFEDRSVESLSCLHVAEHIGLGRYGDPLDPLGTVKAAAELQRVLAPGGHLLFAGPVGRKRTCFNAHRIHDVHEVVNEWFSELELVEFAGVDDGGTFRRHRELSELAGARYACGMYHLTRPR